MGKNIHYPAILIISLVNNSLNLFVWSLHSYVHFREVRDVTVANYIILSQLWWTLRKITWLVGNALHCSESSESSLNKKWLYYQTFGVQAVSRKFLSTGFKELHSKIFFWKRIFFLFLFIYFFLKRIVMAVL